MGVSKGSGSRTSRFNLLKSARPLLSGPLFTVRPLASSLHGKHILELGAGSLPCSIFHHQSALSRRYRLACIKARFVGVHLASRPLFYLYVLLSPQSDSYGDRSRVYAGGFASKCSIQPGFDNNELAITQYDMLKELMETEKGRVFVAPLDWTAEPATFSHLADANYGGEGEGHRSWDMVIGTDLLYMPDLHEALLGTLGAVLLGGCNHCILVFEARHPEAEESFIRNLSEKFSLCAKKKTQTFAQPLEQDFYSDLGKTTERLVHICEFNRYRN